MASTSSLGKDDAEKLLQSVLPLARTMLAEHGEFYPYGGYMTPDGTIVHAGGKIEGTDHPSSEDLIALLRDNFETAAREGLLRAAALLCDVRIKIPGTDQTSDAIRASLDHREGYHVDVFFPYSIHGEKQVSYGEVWTQQGRHPFFAAS